MKKFYFLLISAIFIAACASSVDIYTEDYDDGHKYFNESYKPVSKKEFWKRRAVDSLHLISVRGDSLHHLKLAKQFKGGYIKNKEHLVSTLEKLIGRNLDGTKPIVISYFPAKDTCQPYERATKLEIIKWHADYQKELFEIAQIKPIYIYKEDKAVEKYIGIIPLYKDPENFIEKLFFDHHVSCGSFAVIAKDGEFFSYLGRYEQEYVYYATQVLNNNP